MRYTIALAAVASALAGCATPAPRPAMRGVAAVNEPALTRAAFAFDAAAPGGYLSPEDLARLDGWFRSLGLGYGDEIQLDGSQAGSAAAQVGGLAGRYGLMVSPAAPVTMGAVAPGQVRVIVSRNRIDVFGCPNWSVPSQPNLGNVMMSNFGCAVNANLAAQVANPQDLIYGRAGPATSDGRTAAKAVQMYREWPNTAIKPGQDLRPLLTEATRED